MEFTDCPSGPGWVFYRKQSGYVPTVSFFKGDKPKSVDEIIREIAAEYAIDSALVKAIVTVESNCDPSAISRKGAQGLMQLMPSTARDLKVSKPLDPRENIIGGVKYIKGLLAAYGDLRLALAGYNAGPGAVKKYAGIPPYRETITYVKKVLKYYDKFNKEEKLWVAGS
jgi:soluble lytic murein transglycosylase-like protein